MPTSKTTIDSSLAVTAEMKTFVAAFRTKLEAVGFTSTSDTGQYDEAAGTGSNTVNTLIGHRILRTPDTDPSHSVMPIYMKARFRTVADNTGVKGPYSSTVYPHFGTGSDGASNLSDVWLPHNDAFFMQIATLDNANMWVVRNGLMGGFVIGGLEGDSYDDNAGGFFYHRTVDASGNPTTEGFYGLTFCASPAPVSGVTQPVAGMVVNLPGTATFISPGVYWSGGGAVVALANTENYYDRARDKWRGESHPVGGGHRGFRIPDYPSISIDSGNAVHRPYVGDRFDALDRPLPGLVAYHRTAHLIGDTFTLTRYGASRTFLATALRIAAPNGGNNRLDWRLAILWE